MAALVTAGFVQAEPPVIQGTDVSGLRAPTER